MIDSSYNHVFININEYFRKTEFIEKASKCYTKQFFVYLTFDFLFNKFVLFVYFNSGNCSHFVAVILHINEEEENNNKKKCQKVDSNPHCRIYSLAASHWTTQVYNEVMVSNYRRSFVNFKVDRVFSILGKEVINPSVFHRITTVNTIRATE